MDACNFLDNLTGESVKDLVCCWQHALEKIMNHPEQPVTVNQFQMAPWLSQSPQKCDKLAQHFVSKVYQSCSILSRVLTKT